MKIFFMICWRNIWRHKRRSVIIISSVAFGVFAMILSMSVINGGMSQTIDNTINMTLGHISVQKKGFQDNMKLKYSFTPAGSIYSILNADKKEIAGYTARVKMQGMVQSSESSKGVLIVGIDPEREKTVSKICDYIDKNDGGSFLDKSDDNSILISKETAKKLDLLVGDKMVVMVQNDKNEVTGVGMTVKGLFETPVDIVNKYVVYVGIKKLQEAAGLGDRVSEINIVLKDRDRVDMVKDGLIKGINNSDFDVLSWKDMSPDMLNAIKILDIMMYVSFAIIFVTIIFSIATTLVMAIMERFHEIGVMKSIGTKPSLIFYMIVFESVNLGILGLFFGIASGIFIVTVLSFTGVDFSTFADSMKVMGAGNIIYPHIRFMDIFIATVIVLITTLSAAIFPARKAAKINPIEALTFI